MDLAQQPDNHRSVEDMEEENGLNVSILVLAVVSGVTMLVLTIISCICCYRQGRQRYNGHNDSRRDTVPLEDLLSKPSLADPESVFSEASYEGHLSVHTGSWMGLSGESSTAMQESVSFSGPSSDGKESSSFARSMRNNNAEDLVLKKWDNQNQRKARSLKMIRANEREHRLHKRFSAQNEAITPMLQAHEEEVQESEKSPSRLPSEVKFSAGGTQVIVTEASPQHDSRKNIPAKVGTDATGVKTHRGYAVPPEGRSFLSSARCSFSHEVGHIAHGNKVPRTSLPRTDDSDEEERKSATQSTLSEGEAEEEGKACHVTADQNTTQSSGTVNIDGKEKLGNPNTSINLAKLGSDHNLPREDSVFPKKITNNSPAETSASPSSQVSRDVSASLGGPLPLRSKTSIEANITHSTTGPVECDAERVTLRRASSCVPTSDTCSSYQGGPRKQTFSLNLKIDFHFDDERGSSDNLPTVVCSPLKEYTKYDKSATYPTPDSNQTTAAVQPKLKNSNEIINVNDADNKERLLEQSFATKSQGMNNASLAVSRKRCSEPTIMVLGNFDSPGIKEVNRRFSVTDQPLSKKQMLDPESRIHRHAKKTDVPKTTNTTNQAPNLKSGPPTKKILEKEAASDEPETTLKQDESTAEFVCCSEDVNTQNVSKGNDESICHEKDSIVPADEGIAEDFDDVAVGAKTPETSGKEDTGKEDTVERAYARESAKETNHDRQSDTDASNSTSENTSDVKYACSEQNDQLKTQEKAEKCSGKVHSSEAEALRKANVENTDREKGICDVEALQCSENTETEMDSPHPLLTTGVHTHEQKVNNGLATVFTPAISKEYPTITVVPDQHMERPSVQTDKALDSAYGQPDKSAVPQIDKGGLSGEKEAETKKNKPEAKYYIPQRNTQEIEPSTDNVQRPLETVSKGVLQNDGTFSTTDNLRAPAIVPRKVKNTEGQSATSVSEKHPEPAHRMAVLIAASRKKTNENNALHAGDELNVILDNNAKCITDSTSVEKARQDEDSRSLEEAEKAEKPPILPRKPAVPPRRSVRDMNQDTVRLTAEEGGPTETHTDKAKHFPENTGKDRNRIPAVYIDDITEISNEETESASKVAGITLETSVSSGDRDISKENIDDDSINNNSFEKLEETTGSSEAVEVSDDSDYDNPWDNLDDAVKRASIRYNRRPSRIAAGDTKTLLLKSAEDLGRLLEEADKRRQLRQTAARSSCQVLSPEDNVDSRTIPFTRFSPHRHTVKAIVSQPPLATSQSSEDILKTQTAAFPKLGQLKSEGYESGQRGIDARRPKSLTSKVKAKLSSPESKKRKNKM